MIIISTYADYGLDANRNKWTNGEERRQQALIKIEEKVRHLYKIILYIVRHRTFLKIDNKIIYIQ